MSRKLKLGLIGAGRLGRHVSIVMRDEVCQFDLVAAADISETACAAAVAECGYQRTYADYREMLEQEELDAAYVAPPHDLLKDCCLAAVEAGVAVFCEKPLALTREEGAEVVSAARVAGVKLMVGYCMRYTPVRMAMKELLDRGAVGEIVAVVGGKGGGPLTRWLAEPEHGGGQMLFLGSHLIDQALWMVDSDVERVHAEMTLREDTGSDSTSWFTLRFANGVRAEMLVSQAIGTPFDYLEVLGTEGRIRADWSPHTVLRVHSSALPTYAKPTTILFGDRMQGLYAGELIEFANAIREEREPAITGEDGLRVLAIIDAVFASSRSGRPVDL